MKKLFYLHLLYVLIFSSCNYKDSLKGKWHMVNNGPIINFITDSTGSIEHSDTIGFQKQTEFKYQLKGDTLFEITPQHLLNQRKWVITKLTKDSLIIYGEESYIRYSRIH